MTQHPPPTSWDGPAAALESDLKQAVRGEVRFGDGDRALYATDASNYRQVPIGVVIPADEDDVIATIACCRRHDAPVLARGGGTSLAGQCCNVAVVMDMSKKLRAVKGIDAAGKLARVQPGCVLDHLRDTAEEHGLTFGPDPATHDHNSLGGMLGNNSCGVHSVMAGRTADNVQSLDIVTYDGLRMRVGPTPEAELESIIAKGGRRGEIYRRLKDLRDRYADEIRTHYPRIPRRVSGYNLDELLPENGFNVARALVGSEGTCVTILEAELNLVPSPQQRTLLVLGYPDAFGAGDHVPEILKFGPIGLEGIDDQLLGYMKAKGEHPKNRELLPGGSGWLMVEFGGATVDEACDKARAAMQALNQTEEPPDMKLFDDPLETEQLWAIREAGLAATAIVPGEGRTWPGWEDSAVHPDKVGAYLRDLRALLDRYGYGCALYGHFGDGCIHVRIDFDLRSEEGIARYRRFVLDAADLVKGHGGSFSGEHGDGQARGELLSKLYGETLVEAFREFKAIWDPDNHMNPGKVIDAHGMDENLRLGADFRLPQYEDTFAYPPEDGGFAGTALRCVGVGACRATAGKVMCPSYMATLEEKHSTRGRARLLFEMAKGDVIKDGWRSEAVRDSLDLCLACKGCKSDCPVHVDMATYKAEFLNHYYQGRLRPREAYSMGLISEWARLASKMPTLTNAVMTSKVTAPLFKTVAGIAQGREMPRFARQSFQAWHREHGARKAPEPTGKRVVLFPDTFNNYFYPSVAMAACRVLQGAGYEVIVPHQPMCCGRPLYAWGMLDLARDKLTGLMETLMPFVNAGIPIVGLEPSCVAVFRDELPALFPGDPWAAALRANCYLFGEFLAADESFSAPELRGEALVHVHCHQHAVLGSDSDERLMAAMGLDYEVLDSGCCGMAGSFGFEASHYAVAMTAGERVLLPAVREARKETLIITNGFSCREQIRQGTDRHPWHLAEVMESAMAR